MTASQWTVHTTDTATEHDGRNTGGLRSRRVQSDSSAISVLLTLSRPSRHVAGQNASDSATSFL
jgi:hypothetical protein